MNSAIERSCAVFGIDRDTLFGKGDYPRRARMFAIISYRDSIQKSDDTYDMRSLMNDATFHGLNPEESNFHCFRQRVYDFDMKNLRVLPIAQEIARILKEIVALADGQRTDAHTVMTSKKRVFASYRRRTFPMLASKELEKFVRKGLDKRIV